MFKISGPMWSSGWIVHNCVALQYVESEPICRRKAMEFDNRVVNSERRARRRYCQGSEKRKFKKKGDFLFLSGYSIKKRKIVDLPRWWILNMEK